MSLEDLEQFWADRIEPDLERAGHDLEERPSYQDLVDVGYSGITYTLREHHGLALTEFLEEVGFEAPSSGDYPWGFADETTLHELEKYLQSLDRRRGLKESTLTSRRSRLAKICRLYRGAHGRADLVERASDIEHKPDEFERLLFVFDEINAEFDSDASKLRYLNDLDLFYKHLERRGRAAYNPAEGIDKEYKWCVEDPDNAALSADQVRQLATAVENRDEELLILALCAWGLRRNEVASLHANQVVLDPDDPHLEFEDRKNGPGTVALLYGVDELTDRVDDLGADLDWDGYLFPSSASSSGHIIGETVQARFQRIADRAGVQVRGDIPTSKMGRRFWYTTYLESQKDLLKNLGSIADDQGSSDASVVLKNYLSETERRQYRREYMRERLSNAFEHESPEY